VVELNGQCGVFPLQWIKISDQVTAYTMHANEGRDLHLLFQHRLFAIDRIDVVLPLFGAIRHIKALKHAFVEAVLAKKEFMYTL
jgi:hypothetical protein